MAQVGIIAMVRTIARKNMFFFDRPFSMFLQSFSKNAFLVRCACFVGGEKAVSREIMLTSGSLQCMDIRDFSQGNVADLCLAGDKR
jgi:hypothetical protein